MRAGARCHRRPAARLQLQRAAERCNRAEHPGGAGCSAGTFVLAYFGCGVAPLETALPVWFAPCEFEVPLPSPAKASVGIARASMSTNAARTARIQLAPFFVGKQFAYRTTVIDVLESPQTRRRQAQILWRGASSRRYGRESVSTL